MGDVEVDVGSVDRGGLDVAAAVASVFGPVEQIVLLVEDGLGREGSVDGGLRHGSTVSTQECAGRDRCGDVHTSVRRGPVGERLDGVDDRRSVDTEVGGDQRSVNVAVSDDFLNLDLRPWNAGWARGHGLQEGLGRWCRDGTSRRRAMNQSGVSRRDFIRIGGGAGAGLMFVGSAGASLWSPARVFAATQGAGLSDPAMQPKFSTFVPNVLDPGFLYDTSAGKIKVGVDQSVQHTGLVGPDGATPVPTTVWGYGEQGSHTWPGRTFQVRRDEPLEVKWENRLKNLPYLLTGKDNTSLGFGDYTGRPVVDTSLHWAYSLHGYDRFSIDQDGVPIVPHVHGGHTDFRFDGNPEFFFSPGYTVRGPQWRDKKYVYQNDQPAGTVWYHDHAVGITRLNVYAGMAGFYIIRDDFDTGLFGNPLDLPAFPYEAAFAIQDKMFKDNGELFYPAFPGDPFYADFITGEGALLPADVFPGGGPTGLAEFFGDHMVVNGMIWPQMDVEPCNYRLRFLNGCDSRFLAVQFFEVPPEATDFSAATGPLPFTVIGSDQGLASSPTTVDTLLSETGSRYDVIFDFKSVDRGQPGDHEEHRWRRAVRRRHPRSADLRGDRPDHGLRRGAPSRHRRAGRDADRHQLRRGRPDTDPPAEGSAVRGQGRVRPSATAARHRRTCDRLRRQPDQLAARVRGATVVCPADRSSVRWKGRSPGTARPPRTRRWTPPRSGRSGTSPAMPTPSTCIS